METPRARNNRLWLSALCALPLVGLALWTEVDPDLWGHLRFGLDTLHTLRLPSVDPYSFTQDVPWVNHEWLHELLAALAYSASGVAGLVILKAALVLATLAMIGDALEGVSLPVQWGALTLVVLGAFPIMIAVRPQLWTLLFLVVECRILAQGSGFWALPFIFAVWANLHGGWALGAALLVMWTTATLFWRRENLGTRTLVPIALSAAATLLTPYGFTLWRFLASTAHGSRDVVEWVPLSTTTPVLWVLWSFSTALVFVGARYGRLSPPNLVLAGALAGGALWITRISPLWAAASVVIAAPTLRRWAPAPERERGLVHWGLVAAIAVVAASLLMAILPSKRCLEVRADWAPDVAAADALRSSNPQGRLVTRYAWGEYALWTFGPRLKVSFDGRRETVYSDRMIQTALAIEAGNEDGLQTLASWKPDYVWLTQNSARTRSWLMLHGYRLDFDGAHSYVAVRADQPRLEVATSSAASACFPGPL
ncbi:MAG TPA: hypothetical protein VNZ26_07540 [Vicinamibacterales bacterium]|nr:hypothetical protein [Vicinamibacterales bacterium]